MLMAELPKDLITNLIMHQKTFLVLYVSYALLNKIYKKVILLLYLRLNKILQYDFVVDLVFLTSLMLFLIAQIIAAINQSITHGR